MLGSEDLKYWKQECVDYMFVQGSNSGKWGRLQRKG